MGTAAAKTNSFVPSSRMSSIDGSQAGSAALDRGAMLRGTPAVIRFGTAAPEARIRRGGHRRRIAVCVPCCSRPITHCNRRS